MEKNEEKPVEQTSGINKSKSKNIIYILVFLGLIVLIGFFMSNKKQLRPISMDEIITHNSKDSCWTTISGGVYDVTKFISKHKGGDRILNACGKDATDLFTGKSTMGRVHSKVAVKLLSKMQIGTLQ